MARPRLATGVWLGLLALGGLLAGHMASYLVVAPDPHERAELLALTGHSQHGAFGTAALAATLAAVIGLAAHRVRARSRGRASPIRRARVAALLCALQIAGFVALETWERGHAVAGAAELLHEPAFLIGVVAQLVVALAATAVVLLVRATVDALVRFFAAFASESETPGFSATPSLAPRYSLARAARNLRGPPSPAGSPS